MYFTNVVARFPGATNDSFIWAGSALRRKIVQLQGRQHLFFVGMCSIPPAHDLMSQFASEVKLTNYAPNLSLFLMTSGDSGFPIEPWMLTPFARDDEPEPDTPEARHNFLHSSDQNVIERAIGLLKNKYRLVPLLYKFNSKRSLGLFAPLNEVRECQGELRASWGT